MPDFFARAAGYVDLLGAREHGWRQPQVGALGAVMAHWTLADGDPTVISIPTGTGKTAVAMAVPFLTRRPPVRVLVLAPAVQIRRQLTEQFASYEQLRRIGVLPQGAGTPAVHEMSGRVADWSTLERYDVVVALPNSVSPVHYGNNAQPPPDLFELVIVDEAHHAPADTWRAVLTHFSRAPALLLTATPRRRDGRRVPGSLEYYYPLRRALDEGLYKRIEPVLLPPGGDRAQSDAAIASQAATLLHQDEHRTSVLLVRAGSVARLGELRSIYEQAGINLVRLHSGLSGPTREQIVADLRAGTTQAVGVVGMLGEGFDLPALRLVAYHDKHRSLPATAQLIGRLARVDDRFPQPSTLITVADADVFPELKGVLRDLYDEDADWAKVLPGVIDAEIQVEQQDRAFAEGFPEPEGEVDPTHLRPLKRALVYEVPADWDAPFLGGELPEELRQGARFAGGQVVYSGADREEGLLVVVVRYTDRPKWSTDPALSNVLYELHAVAHRPPPQTDLPGLVLLNLDRDGLRRRFESILGLEDNATLAGPERLGPYLDSLNRISVSSVGVRSTNAATRGRATYRNFMGSGVDRGLRTVDMARSALGHVMFQVTTANGAANAGGAVEKSKLWLSRYGQLRELRDWVDETTQLLWYPHLAPQGPLLPGVDRGHRLADWPDARPLGAELFPGLLGVGFELYAGGTLLGTIEDLDLYVNDDPTGTLQDVESAAGGALQIVGVINDRANNEQRCVWEASIATTGRITATRAVNARHGYAPIVALAELLEQHPPTIYFVDGTTTIGAVRYDSRTLTSAFDVRLLEESDWDRVDITAETPRTAARRGTGMRSIHEGLEDYLRARPRVGARRWIIYNDGSGEIADYLVIEELASGEVALTLWHAKPADGINASVRIKDFQEVVAQALRSRRWFTSTALWSTIGRRLTQQERPYATLVDGSDDQERLNRMVGQVEMEDEEERPWTARFPVVRGTLGIAQPGLSATQLRSELETVPVPAGAQSLQELFSVLSDTAVSDGADLVLLVSR